MLLTPAELERFDPEHALAGTVVIVEVPFDAIDPDGSRTEVQGATGARGGGERRRRVGATDLLE